MLHEEMSFKRLRDLRFHPLVALLLLISASPVHATVIYDGGAPDQGGQIYAQAPAAVAMNFTLLAGSTVVTDAHWWGGCFPGPTCDPSPDFVLSFYDDNTGMPGALIATRAVGTANQTATGASIDPSGGAWDEYAYDATFAALSFTPGTQYWFGITELTTESSGTWGVETTSTAPFGSKLFWDTGSGWGSLPENLAFQLTSVPEPSSILLLTLGLSGLAAVRKIRA